LRRTYDPSEANVIIKSEAVALNPTAVQPLALAVHELATNSAKYGALSAPRGRVIVTAEAMSREDEPLLRIEWRKTGGRLSNRQADGDLAPRWLARW
jgi:two-component sensor histidine kinase